MATGTWGQASWRPSKQQGFLLEVIPLPEGQAVKLLHTHRKHLLELLRRQVSLQIKRKRRGKQLAPGQRTTGPRRQAWQQARKGHHPPCARGPQLPRFPLYPHPSRFAAEGTKPRGVPLAEGTSVTHTHLSLQTKVRHTPACKHLRFRKICLHGHIISFNCQGAVGEQEVDSLVRPHFTDEEAEVWTVTKEATQGASLSSALPSSPASAV